MIEYQFRRKPVGDGSEVELLQQDPARLESVAPIASQPDLPNSPRKESSTLNQDTVTQLSIEAWPTSSSILKRESRSWTSILADVLVIAGTLPFFALAISVARVREKLVDQHEWSIFQNVTRIAATVFPIAFAAILGRLVTKAAAWKLERGSSLGTLEQIMGSRTVVSTLMTQFQLRAFNSIGLGLTLLWLLSHLGGQSALRTIETGFRKVFSESDMVQFDTNAPPILSGWDIVSPASSGAIESLFVPLTAMYSASLLTPSSIKLSSMDLWGNVKIPYLSSYRKASGTAWTNVPNEEENKAIYSSLIGVPTYNIPDGNSTFLLESSYLELDCSNISTTFQLVPLNSSLLSRLSQCSGSISSPCPVIENGTFQGASFENSSSSSTWSLGLDTFVDKAYWGEPDYAFPANLSSQPDIPSTQATLLFQSFNVQAQMYTGPRINYTHAYCKIHTVYVESRINCTASQASSKNCTVVAQRESQLQHAPSTITHLSWPRIFRWITSRLPTANQATGAGGQSDLALYYIQNASDSVANTVSYAHLDNIPEQEFSQRLGQVINSYLTLSQTYTLATGSTYAEFLFLMGSGFNTAIPRNISTTVLGSVLEEVYIVSTLWLALFLFATFVLLLAAGASVVFSHLSVFPEVMGSVSLLVRDSRHVGVPAGGGTMDGSVMMALLKNVEVRSGEVEKMLDGRGVLGVGLKERVTGAVVGRRYL